MPIDFAPPSPKLEPPQITGPAYSDPLQTLAAFGQLRNQGLERQQLQMENQQRQLALQDQLGMRQAMQQWDGKNPDDLFDLGRQNNVSLPTLVGMKTSLIKQKQDLATLDKDTLANMQTRNDQSQSLLTPVTKEKDPVQQEKLWNDAWSEAVKTGLTTPQVAAQHPYPGPDGVNAYVSHLNIDKWLLQQKETAGIAESQAKTAETQTTTAAAKRKAGLEKLAAIVDPKTGLAPNEQYFKILSDYPDLKLPPQQSGELNEGSFRAELAPDKWAEYDATKRMALMTPDQWKAEVDNAVPGSINVDGKGYDTSALNGRTYALVMGHVNRGDWKGAEAAIKDASDQIGRTETAYRSAKATEPIRVSVNAQEQGNKKTPMFVPNPDGTFTMKEFGANDVVPKGAITAAGMSSTDVPTAQTRAMAEKAPRVIEFVDRINQLLNDNEGQLGPLSGRWSEFTAGRIGLPNKGYTQIRTNLGLLQTALMNMHVGSRGGGQMMDHFRDLIDGAKQDPQNLRDALSEIRDYAGRVQAEGKGQQGQATAAAPGTGTSTQPGGQQRRPPKGFTKTFNDGVTRAYSGTGDSTDKKNWIQVVTK